MIKLFLPVSILAIIWASCSLTRKQSGQVIVENTVDTTLAKQALVKIRSLDNAVFDAGIFTGKEEVTIRYRLFKPKPSKAGWKYPLVIVYHGSGAIGADNTAQLGVLPKLFANPDMQSDYPAYVLAPQFATRSSDYVRDTLSKVLYAVPRPCVNTVLQLVDSLKTVLNIDSTRIYVVGFSMGGSTVMNSLSARPELFAAGISIAGIPQFDKMRQLKAVPIWLIHGMDDTENPVGSDEQFYKEAGNKILFWKLKGTTHDNVFTTAILGKTLPEWLFRQRKK